MAHDTPSPLNNVIMIDDERIKSQLDRVVRGRIGQIQGWRLQRSTRSSCTRSSCAFAMRALYSAKEARLLPAPDRRGIRCVQRLGAPLCQRKELWRKPYHLIGMGFLNFTDVAAT